MMRTDQQLFAQVVDCVQALFVAYLKRAGEEKAEEGLGRYLLGDITVHAEIVVGDRPRLACSAIDCHGRKHALFEIHTDGGPVEAAH